jgi:hypothetical protein
VFKTSGRAFGVATALTLTAVILAPSASAALLGGSGGSGSGGLTSSLPLGGDLTAPVGQLLGGGEGVGNLLGVGDLVGPLTGGLLGGGLTGGLLGGDTGGLLGGGLPLGGLTALDTADSSGGEMLSPITDTTLACDAAIPQILRTLALGDLTDTICTPFDGGLGGLTGLLGSL